MTEGPIERSLVAALQPSEASIEGVVERAENADQTAAALATLAVMVLDAMFDRLLLQ